MAVKGYDLEAKHQAMFEYYTALIAEKGHLAQLLPKSYFYELVAERFFLSKYYTATVIRQQILLKKTKRPVNG